MSLGLHLNRTLPSPCRRLRFRISPRFMRCFRGKRSLATFQDECSRRLTLHHQSLITSSLRGHPPPYLRPLLIPSAASRTFKLRHRRSHRLGEVLGSRTRGTRYQASSATPKNWPARRRYSRTNTWRLSRLQKTTIGSSNGKSSEKRRCRIGMMLAVWTGMTRTRATKRWMRMS